MAVRVDVEVPAGCPRGFVAARAEALPFRDGQFAAVISNHSLEHFEGLEGALDEIGRVTDPNGFLYIAVPDSSTVTDRIYRWMARGGGHVNSFTSASALVRRVSERTGLPHAGTRVLCTSLAFLNRANIPGQIQRKLWLFCGGSERNMKLALNGALTVGTLDGANIEIREEVGDENIFIFGHTVEKIEELRRAGYHPWDWYHGDEELHAVVDWLGSNYFTPDEAYRFLA